MPKVNPVSKAAVTVANTTTAIMAAKVGRQFAIVQAAAANTEVIFLAFGEPAVADTGIVLNPGQDYMIDEVNLFEGAVNGICASGGMTVYVAEG